MTATQVATLIERVEGIREDVAKLKTDMEALQRIRWVIVGMGMLASVVVGAFVTTLARSL